MSQPVQLFHKKTGLPGLAMLTTLSAGNRFHICNDSTGNSCSIFHFPPEAVDSERLSLSDVFKKLPKIHQVFNNKYSVSGTVFISGMMFRPTADTCSIKSNKSDFFYFSSSQSAEMKTEDGFENTFLFHILVHL